VVNVINVVLPHLECIATLPCNLSLLYFIYPYFDTSVSQGGVATCARFGGMFNNHFTANLLQNLSMKAL